jgi:hypothetical protein
LLLFFLKGTAYLAAASISPYVIYLKQIRL